MSSSARRGFLWSSAVFFLAISLAGGSLAACGGSGRDGQFPDRPLPAYAGRSVELFDDAIEPQAVGLAFEPAADPRSDPKFRERAQTSDAILRVKIETVTSRGDGAGARYDLAFHTLQKVGGDNPPREDFTLHIEGDSPSAGIVRTMQTQLGGKTFVVFLRQFLRSDGEAEWHIHLSPDAKNVVAAAHDATALVQVTNN
ncbi:MAG: hypothetical protein ABI551_24145 [Polyangiaceae bacterium]